MNELVKLDESDFILRVDSVEDALTADVRVLDLIRCHVFRIINEHDDLNRA